MAREDLECVMHTHTVAGVAVASQNDGILPLMQQTLVIMDDVAYHDYEGAALDTDERERIVADLGDKRILVLRNHGLLTVGHTIPQAFSTMFRAERACRMQLAFQGAQVTPYPLSEAVQKKTREQGMKIYGPQGFGGIGSEWPSLLRLLDRKDTSYRH
jgi:ribulose-5-phosphate 4-epimerase/fuculose-1-phosphate aldolase